MSWDRLLVPVVWSDGRHLRPLNPAAVRLIGAETLSCEAVFPLSSLETWRRLAQRCRQASAALRTELSAKVADGTERLLEIGLSPGDDGAFILTMEDRTRQQRELAAGRRSSRFLKDLLDQTPTIFFVVDRKMRIILRNKAFDELAGAETRIASAASLPQLRAEFHSALAGLFEDEQERQVQVTSVRPLGGVRSLQLELDPLRDLSGQVHQARVVGFDLTDLLDAHAEQRRLQGELEQAKRLEALGQMAGTIAHDFNNFLAVMQGSAAVLRDLVCEPSEEVRQTLLDLEQVTKQAHGLTQDLVAFSRAQVHSVRSSRLDSVLAALQAALPRLVPPSVAFSLVLPDSLSDDGRFVPLSESQCLQITVNLVQNAIDALEASGRIEVTVGIDSALLVVTVSDDGPGVPAHVAARIFEPFFTMRGETGGTGLGLSSAQTLVERVGGTLCAGVSHMGGARFTVNLPLLNAGA
jgi:C4-dicarboxylate-specific signal transduction histidine kinase